MEILVAYHQRLLRESMRPLLAKLSAGSTLHEAATFGDAIAMVAAFPNIDLVLLGDELPDRPGLAGIQTFLQKSSGLRIVLLTEVSDPVTVLAAIKAGVSGVIFKSISASALFSALLLVLEGEIYLPAVTLQELANLSAQLVTSNNPPQTSLSPAETAIVPLLLSGLCNKRIGQRLGIEEPAVKARLRCIYRKMGVVNRAQAVMALLAEGNRVPLTIER